MKLNNYMGLMQYALNNKYVSIDQYQNLIRDKEFKTYFPTKSIDNLLNYEDTTKWIKKH